MSIRIAVAQANFSVGALQANVALLKDLAGQAHAQQADILLAPELALIGYPPDDLLLRPAFLAEQTQALAQLCQQTAEFVGLTLIVGHAVVRDGETHNAASVVREGRILATYCKRELPNYTVFDEKRYFTALVDPVCFDIRGVRFGLCICEDVWFDTAPQAAAAAGAQVLLVPNASPFDLNKQQERLAVARECVAQTGCALVYANLVGGQDDLLFDGASFAMNADGSVVMAAPSFESALRLIDVDTHAHLHAVASADGAPAIEPELSEDALVWRGLVTGVRDYLGKTGFKGALLGLSGGIDSAVVMAVAVEALGADRVHAVMMPSRYTAGMSREDAAQMARGLGVRYDEIVIGPVADAFDDALSSVFAGRKPDTTEENIQARVRGTLLMAMSNKFGHLVLTTGNKSEMATGYCTLYGDMAGAYAVIKDLLKTRVYRLARWINREHEVIPQRIIDRPPSAELREDQTDQDSLPPYEVLDDIIARYVEGLEPAETIIAAGFDRETVEQVLRLIRINEYKRRQAPLGPRISRRAFGRDWRYPLANGYRETF